MEGEEEEEEEEQEEEREEEEEEQEQEEQEEQEEEFICQVNKQCNYTNNRNTLTCCQGRISNISERALIAINK